MLILEVLAKKQLFLLNLRFKRFLAFCIGRYPEKRYKKGCF